MCGCAGSWLSDFDVEAALDAIAHRGPDGRGTWTDGEIVHGHVRLAIQDPTPRSDQPFHRDSMVLTFVGEIWNYRQLRGELEDQGCSFETTGDTEVAAAALAMWGVDALPRMDGMFSLVWTNKNGDTYLARDRFGKVPLYWLETGDGGLLGSGIAWASERRAFGRRAAEATPLAPGCYMALHQDAFMWPWYELRPEPRQVGSPDRVRDLLHRGVRKRLQSDVPVCCLISGGLDSSLILSMVKEEMPNVHAYVADMEGAPSADCKAALEVAAELSVGVTVITIPRPDDAAVRRAISAIEIPMKAQVEIATLCLPLAERISKDGFKVVLSGEGADELFGGYGGTMRKATSDLAWRQARHYQVEKMARGNFIRTNKVFMASGVEARLPFLEQELVEYVLGLDLKGCPPKKRLLKDAAVGRVPDFVIGREKATFQGAAGVSGALEDRMKGANVRRYNDFARELFGGLPRG